MPSTSKPACSLPRPTALVRGVYLLLAAAVLLETQYSDTPLPDDFSHYLPFWEDLATWMHIKGLSVSVGEIFMLLMLLFTLLRIASTRAMRFDRGSLMRPLGLYMLMMLIGEVNGLASGGDLRLSLWEVRPQVYMFVAYILACNLVTTRKQVDTLVWIVLVGTGIKGLQGLWRYQITLQGNIHSVEALFEHEQSFFFDAALTLTAILFLYAGSRRMKSIALFLAPFVLVSDIANQRRAGILALGLGLVVLLVITAIAYPARRRSVVIIILALAVVGPPYYLAFKNSSGLTGEIARAISSTTSPNARDASSNLYRINEDKDIMATMRTSPVIGYGFGKPMLTPYPLPDISGIYEFWNIMPHDSILWVWMRLGTVGYLLMWLIIGTAIVQTTQLLRRLEEPFLKGLAVWMILLVIQQIVFGYLDLQWENYRNMTMLGILFALPSRLAAFAAAAGSAKSTPGNLVDLHARRPRKPYIPHTLAVVDGRLTTRASPHQRSKRAG